MKAAVFKRQNEMAVIDVPAPKAGAGEVVLKVHNCGICGSDLHAVQYGMGMRPDTVMGHEFCGEIHELGAGVTGFSKGERVTALPFISCGECERCRRDDGMHCERTRGTRSWPTAGRLRGIRDVRSLEPAQAARQRQLARGRAGRAALGRTAWSQPRQSETRDGRGRDGRWTNRAIGGHLGKSQGRDGGGFRAGGGAQGPGDETRCVGGRQSEGGKPRQESRRADRAFAGCRLRMYRREIHAQLRDRNGRGCTAASSFSACAWSPTRSARSPASSRKWGSSLSLDTNRAEFNETIAAIASGKINPKPMITDVVTVEQVPEMFEALRNPGGRAKVMVEFAH